MTQAIHAANRSPDLPENESIPATCPKLRSPASWRSQEYFLFWTGSFGCVAGIYTSAQMFLQPVSQGGVCDGESQGLGQLSQPLTPRRLCLQRDLESVGTVVPTAVMEGNEMEEINDGLSDGQQVLEPGIMLGQRRAFGLVAGPLPRGAGRVPSQGS